MGFKGIGDSRDGGNRQKTSPKLRSPTPSYRGAGGGSGNVEQSRMRSLTMNDTPGRYGDLAARLSPFNGRAEGVNASVLAAPSVGGDGSGAMVPSAGPSRVPSGVPSGGPSGPTLTPPSPSRRRASMAIGSRRLSAWTFGSGPQLSQALAGGGSPLSQTLPGTLVTEGWVALLGVDFSTALHRNVNVYLTSKLIKGQERPTAAHPMRTIIRTQIDEQKNTSTVLKPHNRKERAFLISTRKHSRAGHR